MAAAVRAALDAEGIDGRERRGASRCGVLPSGDDALLVELDDLDEALALAAAARRDPVRAGVARPVPAARTVLVPSPAPRPVAAARPGRRAAGAPLDTPRRRRRTAVEIPSCYDGADLDRGGGAARLERRRAGRGGTPARPWTVGFVGFAPGFAYLAGDDPDLEVPRRPSPRTRVPAGSVALAGPLHRRLPARDPRRLAADRPHRRPGLGRDAATARPCSLPGDEVRFRALP